MYDRAQYYGMAVSDDVAETDNMHVGVDECGRGCECVTVCGTVAGSAVVQAHDHAYVCVSVEPGVTCVPRAGCMALSALGWATASVTRPGSVTAVAQLWHGGSWHSCVQEAIGCRI